MIVRIFAPSVLAKPLNNAQMCEAFLFIYVHSQNTQMERFLRSNIILECIFRYWYHILHRKDGVFISKYSINNGKTASTK